MHQMLENWLARSLGMLGTLLLVTAVTGCNPPVDKPDPAKPEVTPNTDGTATTDPAPADDMTAEETPTADDAADDSAATPNASPEETAKKDPLDTSEDSAAVKQGELPDRFDLKD